MLEAFKVVWTVVGILFGIVLAFALITCLIDALLKPFRIKKAKKEFSNNVNDFCKALEDLQKQLKDVDEEKVKPKKKTTTKAKKESKK